jgi:hypothetical protein
MADKWENVAKTLQKRLDSHDGFFNQIMDDLVNIKGYVVKNNKILLWQSAVITIVICTGFILAI